MENYKNIIPLNLSQQNEFMAWYCLEHHQTDKFKELLEAGMPLSGFMLTSMVFFEYSDKVIKEILLVSENVEKDVVPWMKAYFQITDLADVLPEFESLLSDDYPTNDECVQLKLWNVLLKREQFDLLAQNAPEILENEKSYQALVALEKCDFEKYAPLALEQGYPGAVLSVPDGWKYLIDHGFVEWLLDKLSTFDSLLPREDIIAYCVQKGYVDELYKAKEYAELLEHEQFDVFVKNHSFNSVFLETYPEHVDWEDLWKYTTSQSNRKYLIQEAFKNRYETKNYDFLWKHGGWWTKWRLLTAM